jgi:cysteine-rich repeat protein
MKLNAKAACTWLAAPLVAIAIAACGDDGGTPPPAGPCDGGTEAPCGPQPGDPDYVDVCGDGFVGPDEECEEGDNCNTETCMNNVCGDGFVGPGESCDSETDCNDCADPECGDGVMDEGEACDDPDEDVCTSDCELPECGDGLVQAGEECDDGSDNGSSGAGCTDECNENVCGDGHEGPGEACDDGNTEDGDDCTADCGPASCGNSVVEEGEVCDDGNTNDRDDCLSSCVPASCGDGELQAGVEECDDGNANGADDCNNECVAGYCGDGTIQDGEACDEGDENGAAGGSCTENCGETDCGNGTVESGEECDDGNVSNADSCLTSCIWNSCGDGEAYTNATDAQNTNALEECDDDNNDNTDACTNACALAMCGDGFTGPGETCDEGEENGATGGTCTTDCTPAACGNGTVEAGEDCDDENDNEADSCVGCQWNECGDGFLYTDESDPENTNGVEECDDGDEVDTNTCTNACTDAVCGDGIVSTGEACDDENDVDGDGCNSCAGADCGNGVVDPGEECDDGNEANGDACITTCVWNSCGDGFAYLAAGVDPANPNTAEECDDGNGVQQDDCLNTCVDNVCGDGFLDLEDEVEECDLGAMNGPGSTCTLVCTIGACGNGELDPGEECDDENLNNTDSCLTDCTENTCGDGAVYVTVTNNGNTNPLEQCDDANTAQDDLCTNACNYNACGDTFLLVDFESEPYEDPDGTGPMTASRGEFDDGLNAMVPFWNVGMPSEITPFDFEEDSEECENPSNTGACVSSDFDADGIAECHIAICGDGFVQAGVEQCDENENTAAHDNNNDGCLDTCVSATCGDGWLKTTAPAEACDDGNAINTDLCVNCAAPLCGDGIRQGNEGCDNGAQNGTAGNICTVTCTITTCGDGVVNAPNGEQCDNGTTFPGNGDQCLNNCRWNSCGDGFEYAATVTGSTNGAPIEECDDGNDNDRDACLQSCQDADCGDGQEWFGNEECDDGNEVDEDECTNDCGDPACGDGILQDGEACDDGGTCQNGIFADQGCDDDFDCSLGTFGDCNRFCSNNATQTCSADIDCTNSTATCDSTCDGGDNDGDRCDADTDCPVTVECLNVCNEVAGTEGTVCVTDADCDIYGANDVVINGSCAPNGICRRPCAVNSDCLGGATCTTATGACEGGDNEGVTCASDDECEYDADCNTTVRKCSNTEVDCTTFGEITCDVPATCGSTSCGSYAGALCNQNAECPGGTCTAGSCNGGVRDGEACNLDAQCANYGDCDTADADGCHNADPPSATTGEDEALCALSACGDNILDDDEGCEVDVDDNILHHGGGSLAAGTTCNVATCTLSTCGANAGTQTGEECDDGDVDNADVCTNRCREARCGDGIVQTGEDCDDGNSEETDACTNVCLWNVCGDGVRFTGTPTADTGAQQLCDTGALVDNTDPAVTNFSFSRGRDDGDGYDDQPAYCNNTCQVICDGTASESAQVWKTTACLMAAEAYSLAPYVEGTTESYLDDGVYSEFTMDWDDAQEYCEDLGIGATLVKFTAAADRDTAIGLGDTTLGFEDWWVGAEDSYPEDTATPNTYVWLDGTSAASLFAGGQPSNVSGGGCAASDADLTPAGALDDRDCDDDLPFFCEYVGPFPRTAAP